MGSVGPSRVMDWVLALSEDVEWTEEQVVVGDPNLKSC